MSGYAKIGPYELRGELGRGAMARVWRAWDPNLQREVAIKEPLYDPRLSETMLSQLGKRFVQEGLAAARLSHPGIVTIHAADVYDGRPVIIMELIEGPTLSQLLKSGPLPFDSVVDILEQLLDAVGFAHENGIIHRDIKPDNIFVTDDGRVKLGDFGIAHVEDLASTSVTVAGAVLGTPGYMSPEQVMGIEVDARSDIFSVGVVAYEMLTGRNPFGAAESTSLATILHRIAYEPVAEFPEVIDCQLPVQFRKAIMMALEKNPDDRPQTAVEFKALIGQGEIAANSTRTAKRTYVRPTESSVTHADMNKSNKYNWLPYALIGLIGISLLGFMLTNALSSPEGNRTSGTIDITAQAQPERDEEEVVAEEDIKESDSQIDESSKGSNLLTKTQSTESEQKDNQESEADTFPQEWEGSYEGHSLKDGSYVYVSRDARMTVWNLRDSGDITVDCVITSDDPVHGYITCEYMLIGAINWEEGSIDLIADHWIDQGDFEYMRDFHGTLNKEREEIIGTSCDHGSGENSSKWTMSAVQ